MRSAAISPESSREREAAQCRSDPVSSAALEPNDVSDVEVPLAGSIDRILAFNCRIGNLPP